jgi:chemotaxis family two-component system response regulator Rcp1
MAQISPVHILLVEDNDGDILLTREALEEGRLLTDLSVVRDGAEAIAFLRREGRHAPAKRPDLILLDVNLPKMNGHEVLREIKNDDGLKHIPVVMLTTSSSERDIITAYGNHANCYITKPVDVNEFLQVILGIEHFWITLVSLPPR